MIITEATGQLLINTTPPGDRGCLCPVFRATGAHIILFSQTPRADGVIELLDTDYVVLYSEDEKESVNACSQGNNVNHARCKEVIVFKMNIQNYRRQNDIKNVIFFHNM